MAYKFVGYFGNWAQYRQGGGKFLPEQIDASQFTHICFAFAMLGFVSWSVDPSPDRTGEQRYTGDYKVQPVEWNDEKVLYPALQSLKQKNPNLKTLLSIGGWSFNSCDDTPESAGTKYPYGPFTCQLFSKMAADPGGRTQFIKSAIDYAKQYGFDGIDLDWEYPAVSDRGGQDADYANYLSLLQEFRQTAGADFLITLAAAAVPKGSKGGDEFFQWMADCSQYLDWFNVMSYDYHGAFDDPKTMGTGVNAPLLKDSVPGGTFCVKDTVEAYLKANIPKEKIVLGMGTYGRSYVVEDRTDGYGKPFSGAGPAGAATATPGVLAYYEILEKIANGELDVQRWDEPTLTPYVYSTKTGLWVSYDDEKSLGYKVSYLIEKELGGGMIWAIDLDDFGKGFPLTKAIKGILDNPASAPPLPTDEPDQPPEPEEPVPTFPPELVGIFPDVWSEDVPLSQPAKSVQHSAIEDSPDVPLGIGISGSPAVAVFDDKLFCVHEGQGDDGWLWVCTFDGNSWSDDTKLPIGTSGPPALAVYQGKLYCVHEGQGEDGWLWVATFDGQNWSKDTKLPFGTGTKRRGFATAALAEYRGLLYCVHEGRGGDGSLWVCTFDGQNWSEDTKLPNVGTSSAPALVVVGGKLYCVHEGLKESGWMWVTIFDGSEWSKDARLAIPGTESGYGTSGPPAALADANQVYFAHEGRGDDGWIWSFNNTDRVDKKLKAGKPPEIQEIGTTRPPGLALYKNVFYILHQTRGAGGWLRMINTAADREEPNAEFNLEMPQDRPAAPYGALDRYNTALTEHQPLADDNHPVQVMRHHIIPDNRLREFWNRMLAENQLTLAANVLLAQIEENIGQYQMTLTATDIAQVRQLLDDIRRGRIRHNPAGLRPEGFDSLASTYEWLPGNLFVGPGAGQYPRSDDPGNGFETNAGVVVGDNFQRLQQANRLIEQYLSNGNLAAAAQVSRELAQIARRKKPFDLDPFNWVFSHGKYHLR